uniref:NADH-ubiquinone oxidoreductase chain 6 n=2 Tax=Neaxius TaxID=464340 RepID=L0E996_9EUCA|nr:NADH dehydrogenase subunit 6 [Neaxius glyptocercus]AEW68320.1 NADH dehydrogenase subunit 6 [Neaxius glyptocercus]AGA56228.1 NADH dehydrogenase subunit 6 [Neaxius acanthus]
MLIIFSLVILTLSFFFVRLLHPLSMGLTLLVQTCLITISSGLLNLTFWFSYILFLIFLGGMLVLFIYVASLAPNEMFSFSLTSTITFTFVLLVSVSSSIIMDWLDVPFKVSMAISNMMEFHSNLEIISKIYSAPTMIFTLFMVMYLLLTLLAVVKVTGSSASPLRLSS